MFKITCPKIMATTVSATTMRIVLVDTKHQAFSTISKLELPSHTSIFRHMNLNPPRTFVVPKALQTSATSSRKQRRPQNVQGDFFVDHTCIDCDVCRWMAPDTFTRVNDMSAVYKQPSCEEDRLRALQALISCPTSSIHTEEPPHDIVEVQKTFPIPIDVNKIPVLSLLELAEGDKIFHSDLPLFYQTCNSCMIQFSCYNQGVYQCGYHSNKSFGAASYFIVHPEGNILVDCPRYTESLARNIDMMGGALYMFLTHKDDVADHAQWSKSLNCKRIIHVEEVTGSTAGAEIKLEGTGPWSLGEDFTLLHTPGHTTGSVCLLYKSKKVLFTGDHIFNDVTGLSISEMYNFFSVSIQLDNIRKLLELDFEWILPGHRRRASFKDVAEKNNALETLLSSKSALH